ncbi:MAG: monovalent cation/H+ antiporter subunit D family protein [Candidatus Hydrothermarchaeota archaeon]|nr:monovalent cation/H+ antiporter subunit D family protein [Candidatus Hydrothermarchaeota archaeon]
MEIVSIKPLLAVVVSIIGAALIVASHRNPNLRESWTMAAAVTKFLIVASMVPIILSGNTLEYTLVEFLPGIAIKFKADALGVFFAATASFLWILTSIYSIGYMRSLREHAQTRYFACFAVALSATMGVAFSANLITLFLFYEILTLTTYPLVSHRETPEARSAGRKYLTYLLGASIAFQLVAVVLTYNFAGTLEFSKNGILAGTASPTMLTIIYILFIAGFAKAAIMPLHSWLPSAMVAPTPVSALLHAVAVVKVGVFSILRIIFHIYGIDLMNSLNLGIATAYFVSFTIIIASFFALTQDNLKLRLAYSTVSQLSYVILGAALLTSSGMLGGIMQIAMHAFGKITLFFCAGSIYVASHKTNISEMGGIGRKMPFTMLAFFIGTLSVIGVPPFAGFISKWYLAFGSVEAGELLLLVVLFTSSLLNAAYFLPVVYKAFFEEPKEEFDGGEIKEAPAFVVVPLVLTAIGSFILFIYPQPFLHLAEMVVQSMIGGI